MGRSKKTPKSYRQITFRQDVLYFIGWSKKEFNEYVSEHFDDEDPVTTESGVCYMQERENDDPVLIIWVEHKKRLDILVHEVTHGANYILQSAGHEHSYDNDETQAYLNQELFASGLSKS